MIKRTVIKISGEALSGAGKMPENSGGAFCDTTINGIGRQIRAALDSGTEIALVVGGGNFWRGRGTNSKMRVKADQIGMLATVMNALYLSEVFKNHGIDSVVMTPMPIGNMTTLFDKDTALELMSRGTVTFHAAGLGHPFFSTDTVTALRGLELGVDCVLYTKNGVGGVYDKDPESCSDAKRYKSLPYSVAITGQLEFADIAAMHLLAQSGVPAFIFGLDEPDGIVRACDSPSGFGTWLHTTAKEEFYVNAYENL